MSTIEDYRRNWARAWPSYNGPVKVTLPDGVYCGDYYGEYSLTNSEGKEVCSDPYCPECDPPSASTPDMDLAWLNIYLDSDQEILAQPKDVEPINPQGKEK